MLSSTGSTASGRRGRLRNELRYAIDVPPEMKAGMLIRRIGCLFGKHERWRERVRRDGRYNKGVCKYCRIPMWQDEKRRWRVDRRK